MYINVLNRRARYETTMIYICYIYIIDSSIDIPSQIPWIPWIPRQVALRAAAHDHLLPGRRAALPRSQGFQGSWGPGHGDSVGPGATKSVDTWYKPTH